MPAHPLSHDVLRATAEAFRAHGSIAGAARALKLPIGTFTARLNRARQHLGRSFTDPAPAPKTGLEVELGPTAGTLTSISPRVKTLEQALEAAQVDRRVWMVDRWVANKWESAGKDEKNTMQVVDLWQVKVWLKRKPGDDPAQVGQAVLEEIAKLGSRHSATGIRPSAQGRRAGKPAPPTHSALGPRPSALPVAELSLPDVHIGKLAWKREAGDHYDSDRAVGVFQWAVDELLEKASVYRPGKIVLPIGNDLVHVDTLTGTTTSGTHVDSDGRWRKMFGVARAAVIAAVERARAVAPVEVIIVPGNHDRQSAFMLGEVLGAYFRAAGDVTIDNSPPSRKYRVFGGGAALVGWTHGDQVKMASLPLIMGKEQPKAFAQARHKAWHLGHFHKARQTTYAAGDTHGGVTVRVIPSLSGTDAWHFDSGYVDGVKAAEGFIWGPGGLAAQLFAPAPERFYT